MLGFKPFDLFFCQLTTDLLIVGSASGIAIRLGCGTTSVRGRLSGLRLRKFHPINPNPPKATAGRQHSEQEHSASYFENTRRRSPSRCRQEKGDFSTSSRISTPSHHPGIFCEQ